MIITTIARGASYVQQEALFLLEEVIIRKDLLHEKDMTKETFPLGTFFYAW